MLKSITLRIALLLFVLTLPVLTIHAEKMPANTSLYTHDFESTNTDPVFIPLILKDLQLAIPPSEPTPPPFTTSYYLDTINTDVIYAKGKLLADWMAHENDSLTFVVVLAFCQPWKIGTEYRINLCDQGGFVSLSQIENAAMNFASGFYFSHPGQADLTLVVGTNNFGPYVDFGHGAEWAAMVNRLNDWLISVGFNDKILIVGGSDMELGFNSYFNTRDWVNGYDSVNKHPLFDYGDAQGCPTWRVRKDELCTSAADGDAYTWYMSYVRQIAYGTGSNLPLPLIYNTRGTNAQQWYSLSAFSFDFYGGRMQIMGAVTQWQACQTRSGCDGMDNTPVQGWQQLYDELNKYPDTAQELPWSTDFVHNSDIP